MTHFRKRSVAACRKAPALRRPGLSLVALLLALHWRGAPVAADLYVTNNGGTIVSRVGPDGTPHTFASTGPTPDGLAFDESGNLYVSALNKIHEFSPTGADLGFFATTGLSSPQGLAFDKSGNLYVANAGNNTIREFSPTGADLGFFATTGLAAPIGLAFDKAGNLFVANDNNATVREFSPTGADLGNFATGVNAPTGLAFDKSGYLYVAKAQSDTIREFSPTGADLGDFVTNTGGFEPYGVAFDPTGNLYVANTQSGTIREFSPTGADLGNFVTGLSSPEFLAFGPSSSAVPEPSSLTLAGLGTIILLAYGGWRRTRRTDFV